MTSTEAKYKLTYFNARGGGEIIRLIFAVGNVAYEDERIEKETWPERKPGRISVVNSVICFMIMGLSRWGGWGAGGPDPLPPEKTQTHRASKQHCSGSPEKS